MGADSVAILPQEIAANGFTWLRDYVGSEVIATPGCESNVKENYDKCWEHRRTKTQLYNIHQLDEFGNSAWHNNVQEKPLRRFFSNLKGGQKKLAAFVSATGFGWNHCRRRLPENHCAACKVVASEALQCPTLYCKGFGGHRIEGIGDKHVPWIHNVKNTDLVTAIDDEDCMRLFSFSTSPK